MRQALLTVLFAVALSCSCNLGGGGGEMGNQVKIIQFCRGDAESCEAPFCYNGPADIAQGVQQAFEEGWSYQGPVANNGMNCQFVLFRK